MLKCVGMSRAIVRFNSMFRGCFSHRNNVKDSSRINILYLNASHGPSSLVAVGAKVLLDNIQSNTNVTEINLWNDKLVNYRLEHAVSKLNILRGEGSQEDQARFEPVLSAAETLNLMDVVLVATPMWNFTIPYVLKQYIDTVVQPGINFNDQDDPSLTENPGRVLVVISSAGAEYPPKAQTQDFLNPYLKQIFALMGFTEFFPVFIQGTAYKTKAESLEWTESESRRCALEVVRALQAKR